MSSKILYLDVETTGLDPVKNDIVQLAWIVEIDGKAREQVSVLVIPPDGAAIDPEAMEVHGMALRDLRIRGHKPSTAKAMFEDSLSRYVARFHPKDKFTPCAFNGTFDISFLSGFYEKQGDVYLGSWINRRLLLDPLPILRALSYLGKLDMSGHHLKDVCEYFGIPLQAHEAASDCHALRCVMHEVLGLLRSCPTVPGVPPEVSKSLDALVNQFSPKGDDA